MKVSKLFEVFVKEVFEVYFVWMEIVYKLDVVSKFDKKIEELVYIVVMVVICLESGFFFYVKMVKINGVMCDEIISVVFVGLLVVGNIVISVLFVVLEVYDEV